MDYRQQERVAVDTGKELTETRSVAGDAELAIVTMPSPGSPTWSRG